MLLYSPLGPGGHGSHLQGAIFMYWKSFNFAVKLLKTTVMCTFHGIIKIRIWNAIHEMQVSKKAFSEINPPFHSFPVLAALEFSSTWVKWGRKWSQSCFLLFFFFPLNLETNEMNSSTKIFRQFFLVLWWSKGEKNGKSNRRNYFCNIHSVNVFIIIFDGPYL